MEIINRQMQRYSEEVKWVLKTNLYTFVIDHVLEGKGSYILQQLKEEEDASLKHVNKGDRRYDDNEND